MATTPGSRRPLVAFLSLAVALVGLAGTGFAQSDKNRPDSAILGTWSVDMNEFVELMVSNDPDFANMSAEQAELKKSVMLAQASGQVVFTEDSFRTSLRLLMKSEMDATWKITAKEGNRWDMQVGLIGGDGVFVGGSGTETNSVTWLSDDRITLTFVDEQEAETLILHLSRGEGPAPEPEALVEAVETFAIDSHERFRNGMGLYEQGDQAGALQTWLPLAHAGLPPAQYAVADLLYVGDGVERDLDSAVHWFRKAAERSLPRAQYQLGLLYVKGEGVPSDAIEAYRWLDTAAKLGHPDAAKVRDRVAEVMRPEEREAATRLVGEIALVNPKLRKHVDPKYPELAMTARMGGRVILQAVVNEDGTVSDPVVLSCTRKGVGFEEAALSAVSQWRYQPATVKGKPVAVYFTMVTTFSIE